MKRNSAPSPWSALYADRNDSEPMRRDFDDDKPLQLSDENPELPKYVGRLFNELHGSDEHDHRLHERMTRRSYDA